MNSLVFSILLHFFIFVTLNFYYTYVQKHYSNIEKNNFDIVSVYLFSEEKIVTDKFNISKNNKKKQPKANHEKLEQIPVSLNSKQKTKLSITQQEGLLSSKFLVP
mgnify:CR=1 FL=1